MPCGRRTARAFCTATSNPPICCSGGTLASRVSRSAVPDIPMAQPVKEIPVLAELVPEAEPVVRSTRRYPAPPLARPFPHPVAPAPYPTTTLQRLIDAFLAIFFGLFGLHK